MSHVDEGELTAYADGAYAPGTTEAQRIALHLAECANCRNRLVQAQALSARAAEILALATPDYITVPPFEQIRSAVTARRRFPVIPLSWAASVILALGVGWLGRGMLNEPEAIVRPVARTGQPVTTEQQPQSPVAPVAAESKPERKDERREPPARGEPEVAVSGLAVAAASSEPMAAPPAPSAATAQDAAAKARVQNYAAAQPARDELALRQPSGIEYITAAQAERRGIPLHIVPELEVVRIGLIDNGVRVEQKLPDGKLVTLTAAVLSDAMETRMPQAGAERDEAVAVVVTRGDTRITISADLPADSLRALAAKIR
ncbi:MAG: hypothetical protein ACT4O1_02770 [Gemmatimonadota bacterium]